MSLDYPAIGTRLNSELRATIDEVIPLVDAYYEDRYREDDTFWTKEERAKALWNDMYEVLFSALEFEPELARELAHDVYQVFGGSDRWRPYDDVRPGFDELKEFHFRSPCNAVIESSIFF